MDVITFFFPFLCSGIPDLTLGILKMLICVCFRDVLQPVLYKFVWYGSQSVCTVNVQYLQ